MLKVAVVGDRESVSGFKAIGMETFTADNKEDSHSLLRSLCESQNFAVIFITEEYGEICKDIIKKYEDKTVPALILIPGANNNTGEGMSAVNRSVEKAVGSELPE